MRRFADAFSGQENEEDVRRFVVVDGWPMLDLEAELQSLTRRLLCPELALGSRGRSVSMYFVVIVAKARLLNQVQND